MFQSMVFSAIASGLMSLLLYWGTSDGSFHFRKALLKRQNLPADDHQFQTVLSGHLDAPQRQNGQVPAWRYP
jgi:hypothetical protein